MGMNWLGMVMVSSDPASIRNIATCTAAGLPTPESGVESDGRVVQWLANVLESII